MDESGGSTGHRWRQMGIALIIFSVPGLACHSSAPEDKAVPASTTAPAPTVPGLPLVNARTCNDVPDDAFDQAGGAKIVEVTDQIGSGASQQIQYLSSSCTFGLEDDTSVRVAALFDQQTSQPLDKSDFQGWRDAVSNPDDANQADDERGDGPGDATFWLEGGLTDTLVILDDERVFTVEATKNGVSIEQQATKRFAAAALVALDP